MTIFGYPASVVFSLALNVVLFCCVIMFLTQSDYWRGTTDRAIRGYRRSIANVDRAIAVIKALERQRDEALKYKPYRYRGKFVSPRDVEKA